MAADFQGAGQFSFVRRPIAIPADLRIGWRTNLVLLMLRGSRARRASLAKLHVLNCAVRSARARRELDLMLDEDSLFSNWDLRVEPAFGRAIDFVVGRRLAQWVFSGGKASLQLTSAGIEAAEALSKDKNIFTEERETIDKVARKATEGFVSKLLSMDGGIR